LKCSREGGKMKTWKLEGEVVRNEKKDIVKRVSQGVGDNKTYKTVKEIVYILVVLGADGERIRIQNQEPFDALPGEDCTVQMKYGAQTKLEEPRGKKA